MRISVPLFEIAEQDLRDGCREIAVTGDLDMVAADQLKAGLDRVPSDCRQVLISLKSCDFIDSTGIAVIVRAYRRLGEDGVRVAVCEPRDQVRRILEITGLTENGLVFDTTDDTLISTRSGQA
jgi:anti-anti-sigma factor